MKELVGRGMVRKLVNKVLVVGKTVSSPHQLPAPKRHVKLLNPYLRPAQRKSRRERMNLPEDAPTPPPSSSSDEDIFAERRPPKKKRLTKRK